MAKEQDEEDAFEEAIAQWDRRLAEAGDDLDAAAPSPQVWDRISARVDHLEAARDTLTVPADQGVWEFSSPGVYRKLLHVDAAAGWQAFLVKIEPGASVPPHDHPILEECLVLEGEFELAGEIVRKGDLHLGFAGRDHGAIASPSGALLYIRAALAG
jgi:quercetin dioxygenase-like cupin family protein